VIERPHVGNRCLYTHCYWRVMLDKNEDRAGPFRGMSGTLGRKGRGECCGYSKVSMWYPSPVSVKN
jgi:hypothetical protein